MTSIAQHPFHCLNLPPRSIRGCDKVSAFKLTRNIFKVRKGVQRQLDGSLKTMDRANGPDMQFDNVRHRSLFLSEERSKMSENPSKAAEILSEMQEHLETAAGPYQPFDTRDGRLSRAARALGLTHRRAKSIRYGEARTIKADELEIARERVALMVNHNLSLAERYVQFLRKQKLELEARYAKGDSSSPVDGDVGSVGAG